MNTQPKPPVVSSVSRIEIVIAIASCVALAATPGCVEVKGGAVELSWDLRDQDGEPVDCAPARVETMRVCWVPVPPDAGSVITECTVVRTEAGFAELSREFDCEVSRGVTKFELSSGANAIFVRPVCDGEEFPDPSTYQVPPPIVREVRKGEVVTLNQILVVVDVACDDGACTCPPSQP